MSTTFSLSSGPKDKRWPWWAIVLFLTLTIAGIYWAKWGPYSHKVFVVAAHHSLGPSIVTGQRSHPPAAGWKAALSYALSYYKDIWTALVAGLVIGAGVQSLIPDRWLLSLLGKAGAKSRTLATAAAVPAMMCTCCSAPVVVGLKKQKVSTGAALAFWLGNPLLNPATIIFMGFVLGWNWAVLRIVMGLLLVAIIGFLGDRWSPPGLAEITPSDVSSGKEPPSPSVIRFLKTLGRLSLTLLPEYAIIVLGLGLARAWLFPAMSPAIGHSLWLWIMMAVVGTLFVVPTAGEIPIVAVLLSYGMGLGAAGTLMLTLPAVSLPSAAMVSGVIPKKLLFKVGGVVAAFGLLTGMLSHFLF